MGQRIHPASTGRLAHSRNVFEYYILHLVGTGETSDEYKEKESPGDTLTAHFTPFSFTPSYTNSSSLPNFLLKQLVNDSTNDQYGTELISHGS